MLMQPCGRVVIAHAAIRVSLFVQTRGLIPY